MGQAPAAVIDVHLLSTAAHVFTEDERRAIEAAAAAADEIEAIVTAAGLPYEPVRSTP